MGILVTGNQSTRHAGAVLQSYPDAGSLSCSTLLPIPVVLRTLGFEAEG